jgi:hypothetical protein
MGLSYTRRMLSMITTVNKNKARHDSVVQSAGSATNPLLSGQPQTCTCSCSRHSKQRTPRSCGEDNFATPRTSTSSGSRKHDGRLSPGLECYLDIGSG